MRSPGTHWTRRSTRVVLPVPEGADTMNSWPRAARPSTTGLLDILDLFPHAFELPFCIDDELGDVNPVRLRSDRVDFAIHFLDKKIECAAHGSSPSVREGQCARCA